MDVINEGRADCKADAIFTKTPFNQIRVTCSGCPLDYYVQKN